MPKAKYVKDSHTIMTEMVLPNDTNTLSNLMGGNLMRLVDIAGAICAQKHSNRIVVTASVDHVSFVNPIPLGNVITLEAKITRAFNTSMEVVVDVYSENIPAGTKKKTNQAFLTFVAVDQSGRPIEVSEAIPETEEEKLQFERALHRRQLRLLMAGRLNPEDTESLKQTFFNSPTTI
ncbi:acyl-CoA thioesterase [Leadbetterella byssophila]|jgi:acyl-CoA hydrolase|uniref:Thioesterase superfamily protein n=1 Tax=Leadbetterella byssophila (strain DSM 17132 / JCM 16389 / KACC 11308 / NBRC 106382 / 4M15) TaxID=649349 RepID=E4RU02_LEAB4|nr:acyl-CoA thioesterase [Leadbetterella byssophila]ADQ18710.1 thioesterase superfamily protein [Leadbetterella byssophila DSM 17132]